MKKYSNLFVITFLAAILTLSACGNTDSSSKETEKQTEEVETSDSEGNAVEENNSYEIGNEYSKEDAYSFIVKDYSYMNEYSTDENKKKVLTVDFEYKNLFTESVNYYTNVSVKAVYQGKYQYDMEAHSTSGNEYPISRQNLETTMSFGNTILEDDETVYEFGHANLDFIEPLNTFECKYIVEIPEDAIENGKIKEAFQIKVTISGDEYIFDTELPEETTMTE